ncbi:MAG: SLATT domain-containing protein [Rhodobacteraceae bacterium]|nr:SLATT domain-containing protein [Paracoccaceae bacterium]
MASSRDFLKGETSINVTEEARKLTVDVLYSEKGHFAAASFWSKLYFCLGLPAAVLAAAAGAIFFGKSDDLIPGLFAFGAAILTAVTTFLNPQERADKHHLAGIQYSNLRRELRQFVQIELNSEIDSDKKQEKLKKFTKQIHSVQSQSPAIPYFSWKSAKKMLQQGSAEYTDEELDLAAGKPK